jgi:hypothetical protein
MDTGSYVQRILLRVAEDGTPEMQFLDALGKVTAQWPK